MNHSLFVATISLVSLLVMPITVTAADVPIRPNIVILYADDMGFGDLGVQNPESKIPTPNLDRLAAEGMRFTDAHSSSGICTPSRFALLTGRYHWRRFHQIVDSWGPSVFKPEDLTLAEMLKQKGYATACIGKWHLGWDWNAIRKPSAKQVTQEKRPTWGADAFDWTKPIPDGPLAHGFDHYFGDDVPNFPPYCWIENDRVVEAPTVPLATSPPTTEGSPECRPGPMVKGWRLDKVMPELTARAVRWIDGRRGKSEPFFLYFPWTSPHAPIVPTAEWQGKTKAGGFGDFMAQSDWSSGQVLEALKRNGFHDNTLVIFSADNGPEGYAYARVQNTAHRSMGPLRGVKRDIWEGGHRVPFVVRWPGVVKPGSVSNELMSQIDIMATLATIVGADLPANAAEDSFNQLPLWRGEARSARTSLVHNTYANGWAIRSGNWSLIDAKTGAVTKVPPWFDQANNYPADAHPAALYDISRDLAQRDNLIDQHPDVVARLREELARIRERPTAPRLSQK